MECLVLMPESRIVHCTKFHVWWILQEPLLCLIHLLTMEAAFFLSDEVGRESTARCWNSKENEELVVGKTWLDPCYHHVSPSLHLSSTGLHWRLSTIIAAQNEVLNHVGPVSVSICLQGSDALTWIIKQCLGM